MSERRSGIHKYKLLEKEDRQSNKPNISETYINHTFLNKTLMLENMNFCYDGVRMNIVDEIFPHPEGPRI